MPVFNNMLAGASGAGAAGYEIERSLRFNSGDSSYLDRTPSSAGNRKTWTWSNWIKRTKPGVAQFLFNAGDHTSTTTVAYFKADDTLEFYDYQSGAYTTRLITSQVFRDISAWFHLMVVWDTTQGTASDRAKIYINGSQVTSFGTSTYPSQNTQSRWSNNVIHDIGQDNNNNFLDGCLADIHFIDGQALAATDFGELDDSKVWQPIKYAGTYGTNGFKLDFSDTSSNAALGTDSSGNSNTWTVNNLVAAGNSYTYTNAVTTTENGGVFYTGVAANLFSASTNLLGGYNSSNRDSNIIWSPPGGLAVNNPKITAQYYTKIKINGTTVASEAVGGAHAEQALSFVGTLNTLIIENTDGLGSVVRAFGLKPDGTNLVTITDSALTDALRDTPVNGDPTNDTGAGGEITGNYATLNPLAKGASATLSNGNLDISSGAAWDSTYGTIGVTSGKWYWEQTMTTHQYTYTGIDYNINTTDYPGNTASSWAYLSSDNRIYNSGTAGPTVEPMPSGGGIIGFALDLDNRTLFFSINGVFANSANPATNSNPPISNLPIGKTWFPVVDTYNASTVMNFGQRAFAYTAPSGYKCLNTANLSDPTIADGSTAFDTVLYGGGAASYTISGLSFGPDLVWSKRRDSANRHALCDTVRGATKDISSDRTAAERTTPDGLTQFNSDGYVIGDDAGEYGWNGGSTSSFVNWAWDAGSSTVTNTDGSVTASVRASQTNGFSIVKWLGNGTNNATVGHGLNATPQFVIYRRLEGDNWKVYHHTQTINKLADLNQTNAYSSSGDINGGSPSNSIIYISSGTSTYLNDGNQTANYVAYCFAPVEGYSAFGSYEASTALPFVYTGFSPRWILIKNIDASNDWIIYDTERNSYNESSTVLAANLVTAESGFTSGYNIDILSNGFKIRTSSSGATNANTHIYAAFASHPFKTSRAR